MAHILATAALIASGQATFYAPGVMDTVIDNRVSWGQLPPQVRAAEAVALLDPDWIGKNVWVELPGGEVYGPLIVADCAAAHDRERLQRIGWAVDINYTLAMRLGIIDGPMWGVRVWDQYPHETRNDWPRGEAE